MGERALLWRLHARHTGHPQARDHRFASQFSLRYLAHSLVVGLALVVALAGNFGSVDDWHPLALDRAAELPSAFAQSIVRTTPDSIVRPPAPVTQLVNRPRQGITTYKVREGDTVSFIADKFEISIQTILWANGLYEDDILDPGRPLVILPVSGVLHTVRADETVLDIAQRYQSDAKAIIEFNQLTDPSLVDANDLLIVPGGRLEERPRPAPAARSDARPQAEPEVTVAVAEKGDQTAQEERTLQSSTYTVARGDSLSSVAAKFGISTETLMWANGLQNNPDGLAEGQTLTILPVSGAMHTVTPGDTVLEIASRYGVSVDNIVASNRLSSPDSVSIGQKLIIPEAKLATAAEVAAQARAVAAAQAEAAAVKHTVRSGDSLLAIAGRYGVDAASIARANGLRSADVLTIGQVLAVPGGRVAVSEAPRAVAAAAPAADPAKAAPAVPQPPATTGSDGSRIVTISSKYLGYAYTWGGHAPNTGFDCSGFVWYVYQQAGIKLPLHDLWGQLQAGPRVSQSNLQPGDIVFFQNTYTAGLSHDGIYIGGGRFINAQDYGSGVRVASLSEPYWASRYFGASRPW